MANRSSKLGASVHQHSHKQQQQQQQQQDSILVRIAQKPLLVATLFVLTALLPWALSLLAPLLVKAFQEKSLLDLARWLSAPFLFALVNFAIFYLWINSSSSSTSARRSSSLLFEDPLVDEDEIVAKPAAATSIDAILPPQSIINDEEEPSTMVVQRPAASVASRQPESVVDPPQYKLTHRRSRSLTIDPAVLELAADKSGPATSRVASSKRSSATSPKSKPPSSRRAASTVESNKFDPAVVESLDKNRQVARRNSSPKTTVEQAQEQQQQQYHHMKTSQSSNSYVYTPPVREPSTVVREPLPLEKDDLNARIESFLTKFKMERQESNLRALLS